MKDFFDLKGILLIVVTSVLVFMFINQNETQNTGSNALLKEQLKRAFIKIDGLNVKIDVNNLKMTENDIKLKEKDSIIVLLEKNISEHQLVVKKYEESVKASKEKFKNIDEDELLDWLKDLFRETKQIN